MTQGRHYKIVGANSKIRGIAVQNETNVNVILPDTSVEIYDNKGTATAHIRGDWHEIAPEAYNEFYTKWKAGDKSDADVSPAASTENSQPPNNPDTGVIDAGGASAPANDSDGNAEPANANEQATEGSQDGAGNGEAGASDAGQPEPDASTGEQEAATGT